MTSLRQGHVEGLMVFSPFSSLTLRSHSPQAGRALPDTLTLCAHSPQAGRALPHRLGSPHLLARAPAHTQQQQMDAHVLIKYNEFVQAA